MSAIKNIKLYNFKTFYDETTIELNDKHLLLFGENGSGKSSIYWALYTLLQSSTKDIADIEKYFDPTNDENLINTSLIDKLTTQDPITGNITLPTTISSNASVEVELMDGKKFELTPKGIVTTDLDFLKNLNRRSDFISHRLLINFYNFRNSKKINLWEVFIRDIFPFVKNNRNTGNSSLSDVLKGLENSMPFRFDGANFKLIKSSPQQNAFIARVSQFNDDIDYWLGRINTLVDDFYLKHFEPLYNENIKISLIYSGHDRLSFSKIHPQFYKNHERWYNYVGFNQPSIRLKIEKKNKFGEYIEVSRPQSYFNEAKLTSIALSVRFCLLDDTIRPTFDGQILALDDLLVSLDMGNRDKVLDILLDEYASKYKIYLFTHEKSFFDFCVFKIEQREKKKDWEIMEIHSGATNIDKPVIIQSGLNYYDKAIKYFQAKDFTTSSLYLRKELEKLIINRIPDEFSKTIDGQYHNLEHYWKLFIERYEKLNLPISEAIKLNFKQSKLMILNPEAHHNLELPVYKLELERAFDLVRNLYDNYPIPVMKILFSKGMTMQFVHPTENYTFDLELLTDFSINSLDATSFVSIPRCKVIKWQYNDVEFWDFPQSKPIVYNLENPIVQKLNQIIDRHINHIPLQISKKIFVDNLNINNSIWSFKEIINKVGVIV
ncbi:AAA family ATPase [Flavobacterium sp.]|uniref:AAA family ATPase n=1 Tax=Flavobacterium sp. TaxID=239 RepID=UPI0026182D7C|nr:AAA family ATPase [Flavobacterium sp.]